MSFPDRTDPILDGAGIHPYYVQADDAESITNYIPPIYQSVVVSAVVNNGDDFIVLPNISEIPIGWKIVILNDTDSEIELRTPASSGTKINDVDSDGTDEWLIQNGDTV